MDAFFLKIKKLKLWLILITTAILGYVGYSTIEREFQLDDFYQQVTWLSFSFTKHLSDGDKPSNGLDKSVIQDIHEAYYRAGVKRPKCYRDMRNVFGGDFKIIFAHGYSNLQTSYYKIVATKVPYEDCIRILSGVWPEKLGLIHSLDGNLYETPVEREKAVEVCGIHNVSGLSEIELYRKMPEENNLTLPDGNKAGIYVFQPVACPCSSADFDIKPYQESFDDFLGPKIRENSRSIKMK